ncbi:MAG: hypothetical protein O3A46_14115 [Candidatus Poribacteria bacterium]|nr:hypothetical protein [Candidatus Poribacteria bacterium]
MRSDNSDRDIFNATGGWSIIHRTRDNWEASLIQAALAHAEIPFKVDDSTEENDGKGRYVIAVPVQFEEDGLDAVMRVVEVIDRDEPSKSDIADEAAPVIRATPTDVPISVIASRAGLGEIHHIEGHGYELRVGEEPYFVVPEDAWGEFTDFSAQRQEFGILLEKEYESLHTWLREERRFGDFLRLVESTYRGSTEDDAPEDFLRAAGWMVAAIVGVGLLVLVFRWLEGMTTGANG